MKKMVIVLMLALFLIGCQDSRSWLDPGGWNREKLNELEVGMTKEQVTEIMGTPYRREAENKSEWWLYKTDASYRGQWLRESEYLTPLVFENGELVGWGKNYWKTEEQRLDVKIDQTIKQDNK